MKSCSKIHLFKQGKTVTTMPAIHLFNDLCDFPRNAFATFLNMISLSTLKVPFLFTSFFQLYILKSFIFSHSWPYFPFSPSIWTKNLPFPIKSPNRFSNFSNSQIPFLLFHLSYLKHKKYRNNSWRNIHPPEKISWSKA